MEVGEVRVADDRDFRRFLKLAENSEGWQLKYNKNATKVWVQLPKENSGNGKARMLKTLKYMEDVSAATCYDVLHDPHFRPEWDTTMLEGKEVYMLNPNNDISYYAVKCPSPLKNRDFIMQRTWLETPTEYVIFNHSIYHKEFPPRKGLIRGESMLTGYLMRPKGKTSCELTYVTQMDPKDLLFEDSTDQLSQETTIDCYFSDPIGTVGGAGTVPMWAVNKVAEYLAPSILKNLHKACQRYPAWKSVNNPHYKPWLYPEQMSLPRLNMSDILSKNTFSSEESLEDGDLKEEDFKGGKSTSVPSSPQKVISNNNEESVPKEQRPKVAPASPLRQAQSESSLAHASSSTSTPASSNQPSPSHHPYTQNNHRSDIKITKHNPRAHHSSMPAIYHDSQNHRNHPQTTQSSHSLDRGNPDQNGFSPSPHSSPLRFVRKKFAKWTGGSRQSSDNDDLRNMDYNQLQKEIMIREHEARMVAFQEELEMKRREHRARLDLLESVSRGGSKISPSQVQQVLLHRTSSIVTNEMILGKTDVRNDVNGYRNRGRTDTKALEHHSDQ